MSQCGDDGEIKDVEVKADSTNQCVSVPKTMHNRHTGEPVRKRGKLWTEDEHLRFLDGLELIGKGNWALISEHVETRSTTQVASHAQKYFLRQSTVSCGRRRRRSVFDITTNSVTGDGLDMERKGGRTLAVEPIAHVSPPKIANSINGCAVASALLPIRAQFPMASYRASCETLTPPSYESGSLNLSLSLSLNPGHTTFMKRSTPRATLKDGDRIISIAE